MVVLYWTIHTHVYVLSIVKSCGGVCQIESVPYVQTGRAHDKSRALSVLYTNGRGKPSGKQCEKSYKRRKTCIIVTKLYPTIPLNRPSILTLV